jgi:hypothetical protein
LPPFLESRGWIDCRLGCSLAAARGRAEGESKQEKGSAHGRSPFSQRANYYHSGWYFATIIQPAACSVANMPGA